jgi:putative colanic acid biosynthesis glycosyltransferase WcaI
MRIMFMAQCYAPENVSAAVLITELATDLARRGHHVVFITGAPNYPQGRVFAGYRNRVYHVEWLDGVRVVRTWSYISPRQTFWPRLLHYGTYSASAFYGGLFAGEPDIIVSYSPPLPLGLSAWLLSRLWRVPWVLEVEDLYPDAAVAAGVLHNQGVISFFSAMERFLYRHATHVSVISESFRRNLDRKGVPPEKITVIPVWADPDIVRPLPRENDFRRRHDLSGKLVAMYAGNLGLTSCLEDVLTAAKLLKNEADIRFVLVGEGVKKCELEAMAHDAELTNVLFLPYQPREIFPEMLAAADVGLVTLNSSSASSSLPSKIFNVMASARPIVAVAPLDSEIAHLVEDVHCGMVVPPEQPARLAEVLAGLRGQAALMAEAGQNGRVELESRYSRRGCVDAYENMLSQLCREGGRPSRTAIPSLSG